LPAKQRSKKFFVGRREFDPVNVGFVKSQIDGAFPFDMHEGPDRRGAL
jgi:hypothetical protein